MTEIRTHLVVEQLATALLSDDTVRAQTAPIGDSHPGDGHSGDGHPDAERVYAHRLPQPPSDAMWSRLVVRELDTGGVPEHATGHVALPVQVMAECRGIPNPDLLLAAVHERCRAVLEGIRTTDYGATDYGATDYGRVHTVTRVRRPSPTRYDDRTQSHYATALYQALVHRSL